MGSLLLGVGGATEMEMGLGGVDGNKTGSVPGTVSFFLGGVTLNTAVGTCVWNSYP